MSHIVKKYHNQILPACVFVTGAVVLVVEIVVVRFLAPFFGNTTFTFSSVISVILAALSIGYYVGGVLADKYPRFRYYFGLIAISGVSLLLLYYLATLSLPAISRNTSLTTGPLIASVLFFMIPPMVIGMLSPYAIKLQSQLSPKKGIGSVSGQIFFWGTFGSIFGSLSAGFYLIPNFGVNSIMVTSGITLVVLGVTPLLANHVISSRLAIIAILLSTTTLAGLGYAESVPNNLIYSKDGVYERLSVFDGEHNGRPIRFLRQNLTTSGAIYLDTDDPRDSFSKHVDYYGLYRVLTDDLKNAVVLGGGIYTIPDAILLENPNVVVDTVEIEEELLQVSIDYFGLDNTDRLINYVEDGRRFLADTDKRYEILFNDVYGSFLSVPYHFTTREFYQLTKDRLTSDGFYVGNLIASLSEQKPSLFRSQLKTFQEVYPNSYFFGVTSNSSPKLQNIMFVGLNREEPLDFAALSRSDDPFLADLVNHRIDISKFDVSDDIVFTDDYAPVEAMTNAIIRWSEDPSNELYNGS